MKSTDIKGTESNSTPSRLAASPTRAARLRRSAFLASLLPRLLPALAICAGAGCAVDATDGGEEAGEGELSEPGTVHLPAEIRRGARAFFGGVDVDYTLHERQVLTETAQQIHRLKGVARDTQEPVGACFDSEGTVLPDCGYELRAREDEAYRQEHFAMDPELRAALAEVAPDALVPVSVWLKFQDRAEPREAMIANPALVEAVTARRDADLAELRGQLTARLSPELAERLWFAPGAPAATGSFTVDELRRIGSSGLVTTISLAKPSEAMGTAWPNSTLATGTGFTGAGSRVCIIEAGQPSTPNNLSITGSYCTPGGAGDEHARMVAGVVRSSSTPSGIAPGASIYTASWGGCDPNAAGAMQYCAGQSVNVWNWSHTCDAGDTRLFDYWAKQYPFPTITAASGNNGGEAIQCAQTCATARAAVACATFNTLVVGAANDCYSNSRTDDKIACFSEDLNPADGRELPHLAAPGQWIDMDGYFPGASGTSFAAPMVAGAAAQVIQANPNAKYYPEVIRSILVATADRSIDGGALDLHDGVDDRDGAGELNVARAVAAGASAQKVDGGNSGIQRGHDYGALYSGSTPAGAFYSEVWRAWVPLGFTRPVRVVLSWDATSTCTYNGTSASCPSATTLDADLDLYVYRVSDNALMASSTTGANSYEVVQFNGQPGESYYIKVRAYSWSSTSTYYGVAWDVLDPA